jgi:hypothetical protein
MMDFRASAGGGKGSFCIKKHQLGISWMFSNNKI